MQISFVQIFWIVLIVISVASIIKIFKQKEFTFGDFIRVEDVEDDEEQNRSEFGGVMTLCTDNSPEKQRLKRD